MRNRNKTEVICKSCKISYPKRIDTIKNWSGLCKSCCSKIKKLGKIFITERVCEKCGVKMFQYNIKNKCSSCFEYPKGSTHYKWKQDRTTLAKRQERNDTAYKEWRRLVWERDGFKCQLLDFNCSGKIEAHHIETWASKEELRYETDNGITLCHYHHPRKRIDEELLKDVFKEIINNKI